MRIRMLVRASLGTALVSLLAAVPASAQKGTFELGLGGGLPTLDNKLGGDTGGSLEHERADP